MPINQLLIEEFERESKTTRSILEKIPTEHISYKPHEKSMALGALAAHIGEIHGWLDLMLNGEELDFATMNYTPPVIKESADIMKVFEDNLAIGKSELQNAVNEKFNGTWRMRHGERIFFELPRTEVVRTWVFNHIVHHRAQLGVYLRMLNIALPSSYGPTADAQAM